MLNISKAPWGIFASWSHLWRALMVKVIAANETQQCEASLKQRERERQQEGLRGDEI